jgi:hypothetical protein
MTTFLENEWNRALALLHKRLGGKKYKGILKQLDYRSFQTSIKDAERRYHSRNIARHMANLLPALNHLNGFIAATKSMPIASGQIEGLVWGTIQAVIVVS